VPNEHLAAIVLAAGRGTRFRSASVKVLHRAAGRSLVHHVLESLRPLGCGQLLVVVGHQAAEVAAEVEASDLPGLTTVVQTEQLGTGHAVAEAMPAVGEGVSQVLIVPGDTPLVTSRTLRRLLDTAEGHAAAVLTAEMERPDGYGRVLRGGDGHVARIVEERDATGDELAVGEVNAGMYVVRRDLLVELVGRIGDDNAQGEFYLTDLVELIRGRGEAVVPVVAPAEEIAGVNDRLQLAEAAGRLRRRRLEELMLEVGVTVVDPAATYVDVDVQVGRDAVLMPGTILEAGCTVGEAAVIGPDTHLSACEVGAGASVHSTRAVEAVIGAGATVGPFAHLRPGTRLGPETKAGAFVETKNVEVGQRSKIPHLAYVGDAEVGEDVNLSCGVVTVNYDGRDKHRTVIEDGAFVGCDTMLVAPVRIGAGAYTAAGSTITDDVPDGALAIARSRQTNKEGWVARRRG